jgi:hypothetical protein
VNRELVFALRLAVALGAAGFAWPQAAFSLGCPNNGTLVLSNADSATGTCDNNGSILIVAGGALDSTGTLNNNAPAGLIDVQSAGTFDNSGSGTLSNHAIVTTQAGGTLNNNGIAYNAPNAALTNAGTLNNVGTIDQHGTLTNKLGGTVGGTLNNHGSILLQGAGTVSNLAGATLNNYQDIVLIDSGTTLSNTGMLNNYFLLRSFGTLANQAGGILDNQGDLFADAGSTLTNAGTLHNSGTVDHDGTLTNDAGAIVNNTGGVFDAATVNNAGTIDNAAGLTAGTMTNLAGGLVNNSAVMALGTATNHSGATLGNATGGTLYSVDVLDNETGATLLNSGILDNSGTLILRAGSTFDNSGGVLHNTGTLRLFVDLTLGATAFGGTMNLDIGTVLDNHAALTNPIGNTTANSLTVINETGGSFVNSGTMNGASVENYSSIVNQPGGAMSDVRLTNHSGATFSNAGALSTEDDGSVKSDNFGALDNTGILSLYSGFQNHASLSNAGTLTVSDVNVWNFGGGTVTNQAGGVLNVNDTLQNVLGGTVSNAGTLRVAAGGQLAGFFGSAGDFVQIGAGSSVVDGLLKQATVAIEGGTLSGAGSVQSLGAAVHIGPGATVNPGNSAGTLDIIGDILIDGTFIAELEGTGAGQFDLLSASGTVTLGADSTLRVDLLSGFIPNVSTSFDILTATSISGTFTHESFPTFGDRTFQIVYLLDLGGIDIIRLTASPVPVPPAVWILGPVLVMLRTIGRRHRPRPP